MKERDEVHDESERFRQKITPEYATEVIKNKPLSMIDLRALAYYTAVALREALKRIDDLESLLGPKRDVR